MNLLKPKCLSITLLAASLLIGCASTDPYKPQSDEDFVYDPDKSFAMNVVDGSLGVHNGLTDAARPQDADTGPDAVSYTADAIIGFGNGGGLGGAFLSMLSTNQGNKPLHSYYGIVFYPITQKGNVQNIFDSIEIELIAKVEQSRDLKFVKTSFNENGIKLLTFKGKDCEIQQELMGFKHEETCNFIHYSPPKLLKYSTITPNGSKGLFAVIGIETFFTATYLSLELDEKYYVFSPVLRKRTKFPFVSNAQKIYPFIKPSKSSEITSLSIEQLMSIDPWVNKHYGATQ